MTARAHQAEPGSFPLESTKSLLAQIAANADLLHGGPRLSHVGRYQLVDCISDDIHGRVYEAWDPLLDRGVTVKTLQFGLKMSARIAVDRQLLRAARESSELNHRGIAMVHDSGLSAHGVYLATERLAGRTVDKAFHEGWRPDTGVAVKLARRIASALAYAHGRGVIHGGLEPANIVLTRQDRPKLLNFGLVDALRESDVAELAHVHLGCLAYRAPEQLVGGTAVARSDLFALGALLYELLTGRRAFADDTPDGLLRAMMKGPATPLATLRPDLPDDLIHLVAACLSFEPDERPLTAAILAASLRDLSHAEPAPDENKHDAPGASGPRVPERRWPLRWPLRWALATGFLCVAALAGLLNGGVPAAKPMGGAPVEPANTPAAPPAKS
jgi:eukaryotic-like serine/threonine-protein kinase